MKFRLNFFLRDFSTPKLFANTVNLLNNALGVYLIIEILEGFYWKELVKEEGLKNLEMVKNKKN